MKRLRTLGRRFAPSRRVWEGVQDWAIAFAAVVPWGLLVAWLFMR